MTTKPTRYRRSTTTTEVRGLLNRALSTLQLSRGLDGGARDTAINTVELLMNAALQRISHCEVYLPDADAAQKMADDINRAQQIGVVEQGAK